MAQSNVIRGFSLALSAALLLSACGTIQVGRDFDNTAFSAKVQRGVTTKGDVINWLGKPAATGTVVDTNGARFEQWTYYSGQGAVSGKGGARLKLLEVQFDDGGVVQGYRWTSDAPR